MIGNFIADSVKGAAFKNYEPGISRGILLHRAIDHFTDNHPVFLKSVERLRPQYRKYSGVIIDIFYDHFLAKNWKEHSGEPLEKFTAHVHGLLVNRQEIMPQRSRHFLRYMLVKNIPVPYAETEGIAEVLYGMSRRARFDSGMERAVDELLRFEKEFGEEFAQFMPDIKKFVEEWKKKEILH